jgi:hypothetical protein
MEKIMVPYQGCNRSEVTQIFGINKTSYQPNGHTGVDFAYWGMYGKFLVAPKRVIIKRIVTDNIFDGDYYKDFEKGYGILMQDADDPTIQYLYWHCQQIFPVSVGDVVQQGEVVAQVGNSGFCTFGGEKIPLSKKPSGLGAHLHFEKRINGKCVDVLPDIDFALQPKINGTQAALRIIQRIINFITNKK